MAMELVSMNLPFWMPAAMLVRNGHNVLVIDSRDSGESTCDDGRHSAGQEEVYDILSAKKWLEETYDINPKKIGVHGVSGGAINCFICSSQKIRYCKR